MAWYSVKDQIRLENYEMYHSFYKNKVSDNLKKLSDVDARIYLAVNICKTIAHITPDFLFGEQPRITVKQNQEQINDILRTLKFNSNMYRASLTSTVKGDVVLKLYAKDNKVKMQVIQPNNFFPSYDSCGELTEAIIASIFEQNDNTYMLQEIHTSSQITRKLYVLDDKKDIQKEVPLTTLPETASLQPVEKNPIGMIPIIHIPNFVAMEDCNFGVSDFEGEKEMLLSLNKRLSEIDYIISKHADPKIQVPQGTLNRPDVTILEMAGTTKMISSDIDHKEFKMLEVAPNDSEIKYIQPDLSGLTQAFEEIDRILNYILMDTETSPSLLTVNKDGNMAESGKALRFRLMNTIRKIRRKQAYYTEAIQSIFDIAQRLLGNTSPEAVDVEFIDTITSDADEFIERAVKMYKEGLISHAEALNMAFPGTEKSVIDQMILDVVDEKLRNKKLFMNPTTTEKTEEKEIEE